MRAVFKDENDFSERLSSYGQEIKTKIYEKSGIETNYQVELTPHSKAAVRNAANCFVLERKMQVSTK